MADGSPSTVVEKIERMYEEVGGFGLSCSSVSTTARTRPARFDAVARRGGDAKVAHLTGM